MNFKYGIEHEVAFLRPDGSFADFSNTHFDDFAEIIGQLPAYESDYTHLRVGDLGIRHKRWYIEGQERFDINGNMLYSIPKAIEIRTTIHPTLEQVISELKESFNQLRAASEPYGFTPILTSYNPVREPVKVDPPFNKYEKERFAIYNAEKLEIPMMTYGPDLNISGPNYSDKTLIELARKLVYITPYIVPFSFSSPFADGSVWQGLSKRTAFRSGYRPAAIVYLKEQQNVLNRIPMLTKKARLEAEVGRIEFKAFDSCGNFDLYASLLLLLKGLILDTTIDEKLEAPDAQTLQLSALEGFSNNSIFDTTSELLLRAKGALGRDPDLHWLTPLEEMLRRKESPSDSMLRQKASGQSMFQIMKAQYP